MKGYIFRNYTIEHLFDPENFEIGGYGNLTLPGSNFAYFLLFYQINPSSSPQQQIDEIIIIKSRHQVIMSQLKYSDRIIIVNLSLQFINDWELSNKVLYEAISSFNNEYLKKLENDYRSISILDINTFRPDHDFIDWKYLFISQMMINPKLSKAFKNWYSMQINALYETRKKCMILDCDNTLWGGVVGEDGTHGIKLGAGYPGECFQKFQQLLVEAAEKGIILCVCSKNNVEDVVNVWSNNEDNRLNQSHISAYRINWNDKVSNLRGIAEELNIGLDSCVFIDDSKTERELVKRYLPEVEVPDFPAESYNLIAFFWDIYRRYFGIHKLSDEDSLKTRFYKENQSRKQLMQQVTDINDYLAKLEIEITIYKNIDENLDRVEQLLLKTNQFNVTTKRYTQPEIIQLREEDYDIYSVRVKDKFGDNGITGVCILKNSNGEVVIDSYLLSCRILGRNIEKNLLMVILKSLRLDDQNLISAAFTPTAKNQQCERFFDDLGFTVYNQHNDGTVIYTAHYNQLNQCNNNYKIKFYGKSN